MSLKDAMRKAGLKSTKSQNEREIVGYKKDKIKTAKHQEHRNFCEICECIQPDVERFKHNMPTVDAEWICSNCADKEQILDDFRMTNQSEFAKDGRYRRYYGHTKGFEAKLPRARGSKIAQKSKKAPKKYIIDDDGEKNFNC